MSINTKDTVIAAANFWILYYIIRYLKDPSPSKRSSISTKLGLFVGLGAGVRVVFLGTLIPYLFFIFLEIFLIKKIVKDLNLKTFFLHIGKVFFISYFLVILCWPNVHSNIFLEPFNLINESFSDFSQGVQESLFAGIYYETKFTPWFYLFLNFLFKFPIYITLSFFLSLFFIYKLNIYYSYNINNFLYKFILINFFLSFPIFIAIITNLEIHAGIRYFIYLIPFVNIPSSLLIFYLIKNRIIFINKFIITSLMLLFINFSINFVKITPYHYTFLNDFNKIFLPKNSFENDYWGTSLKELIYNFSINENIINNPKIAMCGVNPQVIEFYFKKFGIINFQKTEISKNFDYAFIVNRAISNSDDGIYGVSCFSKFNNYKTFLFIEKNNLILSKIIVN